VARFQNCSWLIAYRKRNRRRTCCRHGIKRVVTTRPGISIAPALFATVEFLSHRELHPSLQPLEDRAQLTCLILAFASGAPVRLSFPAIAFHLQLTAVGAGRRGAKPLLGGRPDSVRAGDAICESGECGGSGEASRSSQGLG